YATQDGAVLMAGVIGTTLAARLSADQLQHWGWRVAMLLGASIVPFGIMLRRTLPETLGRPRAGDAAPTAVPAPGPPRGVRPFLPTIVLGLMMLTAGTIGSYTLSYMTTYALDTLHVPATISFTLIIINGGVSMVFEALSGWLSDRFGRKPVMIVPGILLVLSILPCFWVLAHWRGVWTMYGAEAVMAMFASV